jgi:hypothetical protein
VYSQETAFDYDGCVYFIKRGEGSSICKFAFSCHAAKDILINGGEDMLAELYGGITTN